MEKSNAKRKTDNIWIRLAVVFGVILAIVAHTFLASGFVPQNDMLLTGYDVSEQGDMLTLRTTHAGSATFARSVTTYQDADDPARLHCRFYSTFGFMNPNGAKSDFEIQVGRATDEIAFDRGGESIVVLRKADDGIWKEVHIVLKRDGLSHWRAA